MTLYLLHLKNCSIFTQLQIEEALLRLDERNVCLINEGSSPAIVLGISGKVEELVDLPKLQHTPFPLIKRFSGGGTVVVDEHTLFVSFICQKTFCPFPCYPEPILRWTEELYQEALNIAGFHLRENDYAIGERKCGGNAQYLRKERFVHHTTFLFDFAQEKMQLLLHPKKTPAYRSGRRHEEFLCKLRDYVPSKESLVDQIRGVLSNRYRVEMLKVEEILPLLDLPHRRATEMITLLQGNDL
jgi:lipoate-protein ligase A